MRSGEIDMRSRHAACPVLTGIKWIATKWFHERRQEWHRPCGLNQFDQERYVGEEWSSSFALSLCPGFQYRDTLIKF
ncbi:unnamed protein product [Onchocerca ochengi]|uniref:2OG-FeII_Oxy_4 domain-containing protein n=1 Tax=Onchocerca ochengi TaxID=42157 RepID=A0A182EV89_ONCOC|nr:unnamed protein product [Onchocerca ochengi]